MSNGAPWWAVPGGVIVGAIITALIALYLAHRKREDDEKAEQRLREREERAVVRQAIADFIAAVINFRNALTVDQRVGEARDKLDERLTLVELTCSTPVALKAKVLGVKATLLLVLSKSSASIGSGEFHTKLIEFMYDEFDFIETARAEAGLEAAPDMVRQLPTAHEVVYGKPKIEGDADEAKPSAP